MQRACTRRTNWWIAAVQIVLLLVMLVAPVSAATAPTPLTGTQLIGLLQDYGVVKGDEHGNLNLDQPIKRAEMITILVRALGKEQDAALYGTVTSFPDAKGHWAAGYITVASVNHLVKGDEKGMVRPNDYITYGEAFTMILRLVGKEPTTGDWPLNVFIEAVTQRIVPEGVTAADLNSRAMRGLVFSSLGKAITTITTADGVTYLAKYLDTTPPTISLNAPADTTAPNVAISGSAKGAVAVTINGQPATLTGDIFSGQVNLDYGANTISVQAVDIAGNSSVKTVTAVRVAAASRIVVDGPSTVQLGQSVPITVTAYDNAGKPLPASLISAKVDGSAGTYSAATGKFTAGATPGNVTLTFAVGNVKQSLTVAVVGLAAGATRLQFDPAIGTNFGVGSLNTVKIQVLDAQGALLSTDNGRAVSLLASGSASVSILPALAKTVNGVASFTVSSPTAGTAVFAANSEGLSFANQQVSFNTPVHVVLSASPSTIMANGSSSIIHATLVDQNNTPVVNDTLSEMRIAVTRSGLVDGFLSSGELGIPVGASSSLGYDVVYTSGYTAGIVALGGTVTRGPAYTVQGVNLVLTSTFTGGGAYTGGGSSNAGPASRVEIIGVTTAQTPGQVSLLLRITDSQGNTVTSGNYAFQIRGTTSNGETLGTTSASVLDVALGSAAGPRPINGVDTGVSVGGLAHLTLTYTRSGVVTLTPVTSSAVTAGRDDTGTTRSGSSTSGFNTPSATITFSAGTPSAVTLTAASTSGVIYSGATTDAPTGLNGSITLTASLVDGGGGIVPNSDRRVTLWKVGTPNTLISTRGTTSGIVNFSVSGAADTADDQYFVTADGITPPNPQPVLTVHTRKVALTGTPSIALVRGASDSNPGEIGKITLSDSYLQLLVEPTVTANSWGVVRVYRNNALFYTSPAMRLDSGLLVVNVPKLGILTGDTFRVSMHNGYAETGLSAQTAAVTVISLNASVKISSAFYDADPVAPKLVVYTNQSLSSATVDATKLILTAPDNTPISPIAGAPTFSGSTFTISLAGQNAVLNALQPDDPNRSFAGDVLVTAQQGWVTTTGGGVGAALTTGVSVKPFATIKRVLLDTVNSRLLVDTVGVTGGVWTPAKLSIGAVTLSSQPSVDSTVPGRWVFTLTGAQVTALSGNLANLVADYGWYNVSYNGTFKAAKVTVPVSAAATMRGATYNRTTGVLTIAGSGFSTVKRDTNDNTIITGFDITKLTVVNEASGGTSYSILSDAQTVVTVVSDTVLTVTLKNANKAAVSAFSGNLVFLTTAGGWFTDTGDRGAANVTGHQCGVGFTN